MSKKSNWIYGFLILALLFSCNSPKRQKKVNDGKLFEKLGEKKGYLNVLELKRLEQDFSLKLLEKYDLSGYDEEDTLAYYVRSGPYVWIASCYLGEDDNMENPFFCLKETAQKGFDVLKEGVIPSPAYGDCSYELDKLLILKGEYVFVSQKSSGSSYCYDAPLIFHSNGKQVWKQDDLFQVVTWNCPEENEICFKRKFDFGLDEARNILIQVHETRYNWEAELDVGSSTYDLRFVVKNNAVRFQDTVYK